MTFRIKRAGQELYLASDIDPGGMSVSWGSKKNADTWADRAEAKLFMVRVAERYPNETMDIAEESTFDERAGLPNGIRRWTIAEDPDWAVAWRIIDMFKPSGPNASVSYDPHAVLAIVKELRPAACSYPTCDCGGQAPVQAKCDKPLRCDHCGATEGVTSNLMFDLCPGCTIWVREEHARYAERGLKARDVRYTPATPERATPSWLGRVAGRFFGSAH